jgi:hypothetical protein
MIQFRCHMTPFRCQSNEQKGCHHCPETPYIFRTIMLCENAPSTGNSSIEHTITGTLRKHSKFPHKCAVCTSSARALVNMLKLKDGTQDAEVSKTRIHNYTQMLPDTTKGTLARLHAPIDSAKAHITIRWHAGAMGENAAWLRLMV